MPGARYTYRITAATNTFTARANSNLDDDVTEDIWTIDQTGILTCSSDDASS
jgi:hypothetical protein